ncbi:kinase-like domain-containing protein [Nemania sp. FL0031]|nr:kinase-like domain-containing protein [Nemania sp. FL0031]
MAHSRDMQVGDWKLKGHLLESKRLLIQVEVHNSLWVNIVVEQPAGAPAPQSDRSWRALLSDWFIHRNQQPASEAKASEALLLEVLRWCDEHYRDVLPQFGSTLYLADVDADGRPTVTEKMDPTIIDALPTAHSLFGKQAISMPVVSKSELRVQAVDGTFFLPQTRLVSYDGKTLVAKGPASAARALDDLREAVNLSLLQSDRPHPNILLPPTALVRLSDDDERICGFLIPFYENGNLDSYARKLLRAGKLTPDILWAWFRQLLSATRFLIDAGRWHGDIKPDNIVVDSSGAIVLIDLASKYSTISIASPEVIKAKERGSLEVPADWSMAAIEKSEVYSIGRTLFFVSEGIAMEDIYSNPKNAHASQTFFTNASSTPADLRELIQACVQDDPGQRPGLEDLALSYGV